MNFTIVAALLSGGAMGAGAGEISALDQKGGRDMNVATVTVDPNLRLTVTLEDKVVHASLQDDTTGINWCDGISTPEIAIITDDGPVRIVEANKVEVEQIDGQSVMITTELGDFILKQEFTVGGNPSGLNERITVANRASTPQTLTGLSIGFVRTVTDAAGEVLPAMRDDRLVAVPFEHRADDPPGFVHNFPVADILTAPGRQYHPQKNYRNHKEFPSPHHRSEGWAWVHGERSLGIFSFNQTHLTLSAVTPRSMIEGKLVQFGGAFLEAVDDSQYVTLAPGEILNFGVTRYASLAGGHREACYAYRSMLDELGCRFPSDYNPPVHWNQLYNMDGAWNNRSAEYTLARIESEAALAKAYSCESLYLDPGWDTTFGSFLWGKKWLGDEETFIENIQHKYGLNVALHTPLSPWASDPTLLMGPFNKVDWPAAADRMGLVPGEPPIQCMGSIQYQEEAARRLLGHCATGVKFLMFDGTWWNGECTDPAHGHPIPYRQEDHMRACVKLAQRVHEVYPDVLIEMHDMLAGGSNSRMTPVYYKYGLPGSYDENWGFELMWDPFADLTSGRALALYDYNLGGNIPIYLHIDLRKDNKETVLFWWYASTCRHLGIGGTHPDPAVVENQQAAMQQYRELEAFYKRGSFYGIHSEVHLHVLAERQSAVVNVFNLSDTPRTISGETDLAGLGLDPKSVYTMTSDGVTVADGILRVQIELPPWSARVVQMTKDNQ